VLVQDDNAVMPDDGAGSELAVDDDRQDVNNEDYNEISVPLTIILAVIGGYIFVGTVLFGIWEGWDPLTAAYYCFITIATIGFGDVVPDITDPGEQYILLGTALYMLFGMATLSMCFTLVQDQMAAKFRLLGEKFGMFVHRVKNGNQTDNRDSRDKPRALSLAANNVLSQFGVVPAAGTEVFEMRRKRRAAQLKFRWIQQRLSRKRRGIKQQRVAQSATSSQSAVIPRMANDSVINQRLHNGPLTASSLMTSATQLEEKLIDDILPRIEIC
jgi:Ion channel